MDHLEHPSEVLWDQRQQWFENTFESFQHAYASYMVSDHASALAAEVQACYCTGAWVAVLVLCMSGIEAQLRLVERLGTARSLLEETRLPAEFHTLRRRRNDLLHGSHESEALTVEQQWNSREELKLEAEGAVRLLFQVVFLEPGL